MKRKFATFTLSCLVVMCIAVLLNVKNTHAAISNMPVQNVDEISKPYTDSDTLLNYTYNGSTWTIETYVQGKNNNPSLKSFFQGNQTTDDPFTAIIPKQLFAARGEYLHFGNEYGFYVHTRGVNQAGDGATIKPYQNSNLVTVMVFDITRVVNQTTMSCDMKIEPLFCFDYAYIVPQYYYGSQIFYYWQPYYSNWEYGEIVEYKQKGFHANGKSDIVIALPDGRYYSDYDGEHFQERWQSNERYVITGAAMAFELENVDNLNADDSGYVLENDMGAYFNMSAIKYTGGTLHSSDLGLATLVKFLLGFAGKPGNIFSLIDFIADTYEESNGISGQASFEGNISVDYDISLLPNDRAIQIDEYGKLIRTIGASYTNQSNSTNPLVFRANPTDGHYFQMIAQFGNPRHWETKMDVFFDFTLAFRSNSSVLSLREVGTHNIQCGDSIYYFQ